MAYEQAVLRAAAGRLSAARRRREEETEQRRHAIYKRIPRVAEIDRLLRRTMQLAVVLGDSASSRKAFSAACAPSDNRSGCSAGDYTSWPVAKPPKRWKNISAAMASNCCRLRSRSICVSCGRLDFQWWKSFGRQGYRRDFTR